MQKGEIESAERRALNLFDKWNDVTGCIPKHCGYYYEIQGIIKDAVHCGAQQALNDFKPLDGEYENEQAIKADRLNRCSVCKCFDVHAPWCSAGHGAVNPPAA